MWTVGMDRGRAAVTPMVLQLKRVRGCGKGECLISPQIVDLMLTDLSKYNGPYYSKLFRNEYGLNETEWCTIEFASERTAKRAVIWEQLINQPQLCGHKLPSICPLFTYHMHMVPVYPHINLIYIKHALIFAGVMPVSKKEESIWQCILLKDIKFYFI